MENNGLADPFVAVRLGKVEQKSSVVKRTLNPAWSSEEFDFYDSASTKLYAEVFDWNLVNENRSMGRITISVAEMSGKTQWCSLLPTQTCPVPSGMLQVRTSSSGQVSNSRPKDLGEKKGTFARFIMLAVAVNIGVIVYQYIIECSDCSEHPFLKKISRAALVLGIIGFSIKANLRAATKGTRQKHRISNKTSWQNVDVISGFRTAMARPHIVDDERSDLKEYRAQLEKKKLNLFCVFLVVIYMNVTKTAVSILDCSPQKRASGDFQILDVEPTWECHPDFEPSYKLGGWAYRLFKYMAWTVFVPLYVVGIPCFIGYLMWRGARNPDLSDTTAALTEAYEKRWYFCK